MDYLYLGVFNALEKLIFLGYCLVVFFIIGPYVFKKIGEWLMVGMSIGGLEVLQKINKVKGEKKDEKKD